MNCRFTRGIARSQRTARVTRAFTLLELLCALTLSVSLVVAAMSLMGVVSRRAAILRKVAPVPAWSLRFETMLREELQNAWRYDQTKSQLMLTGPLAKLRSDGRALQLPAQVSYRVETRNKRNWLIRREQLLDAITNEPASHTAMFPDIARIEVEVPGESTPDGDHRGRIPISMTARFHMVDGSTFSFVHCR